MKLEYTMLAHPYKHDNIAGYYVSEKLDGERAFWDGGMSRGCWAKDVAYANTIKDTKDVRATGLWSRTGKVVHAPDSWLDKLPPCLLDGELYLGRGQFQRLRTIVGRHTPGPEWAEVSLNAFDVPSWDAFNRVREIKVRSEYAFWVRHSEYIAKSMSWPYDFILKYLKKRQNDVVRMIEQEQLPLNYHEAVARMKERFHEVLDLGGEGLMLRRANLRWTCIRTHNLLKYKPTNTATAVITGFTAGRKALLGKIGALILDFNGKRLELSGLNHAEREFDSAEWALGNPGQDAPTTLKATYFERGQTIKFKYRELSDEGIPKEARYWRG